ncbi:MAG: PQQ-binding-like beta-propeller repeat protein, partial [Pseudomonadales bacterium]|nr:PQQ-binding-like beta-propeller repeat protein [Pseudomonadales bacterium]
MSSGILSRLRACVLFLIVIGLPVSAPLLAADSGPQFPGFTAQQAEQGEEAYMAVCATCHGDVLQGLALIPALSGSYFAERWVGQPLADLADNLRRMPPGAEDSLSDSTYTALLAFLLRQNGISAGGGPLPEQLSALTGIALPPAQPGNLPRATTSQLRYDTGGPLADSPLLAKFTPVTGAELLDPPAEDWLNWRRTLNAWGHSPLQQINRDNVKSLQLAWAWSLPEGANMMVPLVRNGILYSYSFGDVVQAFDAASGELLWGWQRQLEPGRIADSKKGLAISGNLLLVPTSDMHLVALDARNGRPVWDHKVALNGEDGHWFKSAPVIANGKAIIGLTGRQAVEGGNFILAIDLATGTEAWRFWTVARPGQPGGDTWNGLTLEQRTGGSVWIPGSFDPELNLVYFGPAPTYDTERLRKGPEDQLNNNDALYTNSTVALDADTGELIWFYQHAANDQLDHDWAYERQILELPVNGVMRKVVVTGGKLGIFDALDAATGEYLWSFDLDMQNVVAEIDPRTGTKTLFPSAVPALDAKLTQYSLPGICPDWLGARNMQATAFNPNTHILYIPLSDTCRDDSSGERWQKYPDPDAEGMFGIISAVDLNTRNVVWGVRQPGPQAAANLSTDG